MARTALTDGSGKWFDDDTAIHFKETLRFDGRNNISVHTDDQWHHEELYYTKGGKWVLYEWSNWQGSKPTYSLITEEEAIEWFVIDGCIESDLDRLPAKVKEAILSGASKAEI